MLPKRSIVNVTRVTQVLALEVAGVVVESKIMLRQQKLINVLAKSTRRPEY